MKKNNVTKKVMENVAVKVATADANAACPFITFQPKLPQAVKKMRKF